MTAMERFRAVGHDGPITDLVVDYGSTLTDRRDPVDADLGMRPVTFAARQALLAVAAANVRLTLLSNTREGQDRRRALAAAGMADLFGDRIFLSHELGMRKPDPVLYVHVFKQLGVASREQVLCCGNNVGNDVWPALVLKFRAVLLGEAPPEGMPDGAIRIDDISQLPDVLTGGSGPVKGAA